MGRGGEVVQAVHSWVVAVWWVVCGEVPALKAAGSCAPGRCCSVV